ncbi:helix-turn-helix domain-containing protein [Tomitella gaofuii]|uniref:helix-turn-helix domain-containing protein n=1 Tax=Tomitella gaofuii TaxID=2760083 RepID=UPI0015F8B202|nr:helix-turn-helix transcriptional regulator [Tomitella gaofuii]
MTPHAGRLIWTRLDLGLTKSNLADWLGVHQKSVSRWERSERPMPDEFLPKIDELHCITNDAIERVDTGGGTVALGDPEDFHAFWDTWPEYEPLPPSWWWVVTHRAQQRGHVTVTYADDNRYSRNQK